MDIGSQLARGQDASNKLTLVYQKRLDIARERYAEALKAAYADDIEPMLGKGTLAVDWDDEIVKATLLTRGGRVVHPAFAPKGEGGA